MIEDLLDLAEEREDGSYHEYPDGNKEIIEEVRRQMAIERGEGEFR